ncbi:hypothetical protein J7J84_01515 [bacterium]|nr:hypothetical protein [bacterium]
MGQPYDPMLDYWKQLREAIIEFHRAARTSSRVRLQNQIGAVHAANKVINYQACVNDYLGWLGRKTAVWFDFQCTNYTQGGVRVKVNPELGLEINGTPHLVKLYFKADGLSKRAVDPLLHLIGANSSRNDGGRRPTPAILDIRQRKLYTPTRTVAGLSALLQGEAAAFETIYRQLPQKCSRGV